LHKGLGEALLARGLDVVGREIQGEFKTIGFAAQVSTIANDLQTQHWNNDSLVIANSFGAYLFLHAQTEMAPYIGRVLLLSPIVGEFDSEELQMGFIPPRAKKLFELATANLYPTPANCQIHVGSDDWQSNPTNVTRLGQLLNVPVTIVPNNGHMLDRSYVSQLLDSWL
jgi:predicted alpha/beta hydrolase family esterase